MFVSINRILVYITIILVSLHLHSRFQFYRIVGGYRKVDSVRT